MGGHAGGPYVRRIGLLVGVVVVAGIASTLLAWSLASRVERDRSARVFAEESVERINAVREAMHDSLQGLVAVNAFWRASEEVTEAEFVSFAREIRARQTQLGSVAWVPLSTPGDRERYPTRYEEPPGAGVGGTEPERRPVFDAALAAGRERFSGPIGSEGEGRLLAVLPVRRAGAAVEGFVVGTVLVERLLERALGSKRDVGIDVELLDGGAEGAPPVVRHAAGRSATADTPLRREETFVLGGRRWLVRTSAVAGHADSILPGGVLAVGLFGTAFVAATVLVLHRKNVALQREASERRRAEAARLAVERQMFETQKLESLGTFAGGVAHDFNNILTGILGNADLARRKLAPGHPATECLDRVLGASERAAALTGQLLDYVGRGGARRERIDLDAVIQDMRPLLVASIPRKVLLRLEPGGAIPRVEGDATQIRQVVANLVANGAEACDREGGTVTVRTGVSADGRCVLEVEDSGSGIDAETLARIFDPFFSTKFTGRGLGLAAVHGIVRAHAGNVSVDSRPGRGTIFRVDLPAAPEAVAGPEPVARPAATGAAILVVDDEPSIRELARAALEEEGFRVLEAADGTEAVALFLDRGAEIGLVLTDMTMPRMHGDEALAAIRAAGGEVPAVLMTGYSEVEAAGRFETLRLRGILKKPFLPAELVEKVRAALS